MGKIKNIVFDLGGVIIDLDRDEPVRRLIEIGVTKSDREIFDRMVLDSGIKPEETLFVDDGKNNIVVGQELGFHTYQPLNGEDWRGRLDEILSKS